MTQPRRRLARAALATVWACVIAGLLGLGVWQVQRRAWKLGLIAQVEARIHAAPVPAPTAAGRDDAYRRVVARGRYLTVPDTFVQAVTERGPGWWVMSPLRRNDGLVVYINRGFVPDRRAAGVGGQAATVVGLLRLDEPGGGFLRRNDAARDRWFSRDVVAIAARRGIGKTTGYFIDAERGADTRGAPVGGLTVVRFTNNHLVYAITWFILAAMAMAGFLYWLRPVQGENAR